MLLVLTNVPDQVFTDEQVKSEFLSTIQQILPLQMCQLTWLKSFNRIIVSILAELNKGNSIITSSRSASLDTFDDLQSVKLQLNTIIFHGRRIKAYEGEQVSAISSMLKVPEEDKMFLISPPSSPPIGWTSVREGCPVPHHEAHADNLENAIEELKLEESAGAPSLVFAFQPAPNSSSSLSGPLKELSGGGFELPKIVIYDSDCFDDQKSSQVIPRTRMPNM